MTEPIPLSLVQAGVELTEPRGQPAGPLVTWVQRWRGTSAIVGCISGGGHPVQLLTFGPDPAPGRGSSGGCYQWTGQNQRLVYVAVDGRIWVQHGASVVPITDDGVASRAPSVDHQTPDGASTFVVYVADEDRILLTTLDGRETQRLDDGRHAFCFDPAVSPDGGTVSWIGWNPPDMPWDGAERVDCRLADGSLTTWRPPDGALQQPRFAPDGTPMHVHDGSGWLNVHLGDRPVVAEPIEHAGPTWGMGQRSYDVSDDGSKIVFTRNEAGFGSLCLAELVTGEVRELGRGVHGHVAWLDGYDAIVALRTGARTPTEVVVYSIGSGDRWPLAFGPAAAWRTDSLPEPQLVETPSADGSLTLHARRYVAGNGRMLCWVHGGPTDQWPVEWRPRITYWWSRGWDVLVVDPRGTTGHGRAYQQALHGGWGRLDVDDTASLIAHAHREGWSRAERTVVIGGSSGGLTVLGVMADHPHLVAGGVASYPVSDLLALTESTHRFEAHYTDTLVAPLDGSERSVARFRALSPIHRVDRVAAPLLVFHGTEDPVVPIEQSRALVERIESAGGDVDLVVYEAEGHGFRDPENVADEYARTERFLDRVVGS